MREYDLNHFTIRYLSSGVERGREKLWSEFEAHEEFALPLYLHLVHYEIKMAGCFATASRRVFGEAGQSLTIRSRQARCGLASFHSAEATPSQNDKSRRARVGLLIVAQLFSSISQPFRLIESTT
jgi:hypothetical protein